MNANLLAQASNWNQHLYDVKDSAGEVVGQVPALSAFEVIFQNILGIAAGAAGLACFIMIIIGGFKYLTAQGDPKKTEAAKQTLTWSIVGIVVLIASWFIINFVSQLTGAQILDFSIPSPAEVNTKRVYPTPTPAPKEDCVYIGEESTGVGYCAGSGGVAPVCLGTGQTCKKDGPASCSCQ